MAIKFSVQGIPAPKGSAKAYMRPGMKFPVVTHDNPKTKPWEQAIRAAAIEAGCQATYTGPVWVRVVFLFPRPKGHYRANGVEIRASAPTTHTTKPDLDKLVRALLDGLNAQAFVDDNQVVEVTARKRYARAEEQVGAHIEIDSLIPGLYQNTPQNAQEARGEAGPGGSGLG